MNDEKVEMDNEIGRTSEALYERDGACSNILGSKARLACKVVSDNAIDDTEHVAHGRGMSGE